MTSYLPNEYTSSRQGTEKKSHNINPYLAMLIITIVGAFMALLIIHVIYSNTITIISSHNAVIYKYPQ